MSYHFSRAKILAFLQPAIAVVSGAVAAWLFVHVQFLGIFHIQQSQAALLIGSGITFLVTTALTWLSIHQHLVPITSAVRFGYAPPPRLAVSSIVMFVTPYISVLAGGLTAWLFVHLHVLAFFHVTQAGVAQAIASGTVLALTAVLTWLSAHWHILPMLRPPPPIGAGNPPSTPRTTR